MAGPILRLKALEKHTGLSRSVIYDRMNETSTRYAPDFPKSFPLGGGAVGWFQEDVDAWLEKCAAKSKEGTTPKKSNVTAGVRTASTTKKSPPRQAAFPKPPRAPGSRSLGETLVDGEKIIARILGYLQMATWTPTMGALLVTGIASPVDCTEVPDGGIGLDGKPLHASNPRFHEARRILKEWSYWEEDSGQHAQSMEPFHFLTWCIEEEIHAEWLALVLEVSGCTDEKTENLTAVKLAKLANR